MSRTSCVIYGQTFGMDPLRGVDGSASRREDRARLETGLRCRRRFPAADRLTGVNAPVRLRITKD